MSYKKVGLVGIAVVAVMLVVTLSAWSDEQSGPVAAGTISVTGEAEVRVVPDEVILSLGIETWNKDLSVAKGQNDAILGKVLGVAEEYGIAGQHVQTDYVSIEPRYRNGYYEERDFIGYFVHKTVVITLRDLDKFEAILGDALDAGVNYVHGIEFRTTQLRQHRDEARALAIRAAREKAEALAGELDQVVGAPTHIEEVQNTWWSGYGSWWGGRFGAAMSQNVIQELGTGGLAAGSELAPGQIGIKAQVSVSFSLEN